MDSNKVYTEEELMEIVDYLCGLQPGERPLQQPSEDLGTEIEEALGITRTATKA